MIKELTELELQLQEVLIERKQWIEETIKEMREEHYRCSGGKPWVFSEETRARLGREKIDPIKRGVKIINHIIDQLDYEMVDRWSDGGGI